MPDGGRPLVLAPGPGAGRIRAPGGPGARRGADRVRAGRASRPRPRRTGGIRIRAGVDVGCGGDSRPRREQTRGLSVERVELADLPDGVAVDKDDVGVRAADDPPKSSDELVGDR